MARITGAINMTLDGVFDHDAVDPDEEIHQHYSELIQAGDLILYGRITYELMTFWQEIIHHPTGKKDMDDFAIAIDKIPKLIFSRTLPGVGWATARLAKDRLAEEVQRLRRNSGAHILVGSRSLILQLLAMDEIDELQLCIHPVIAARGTHLFEHFSQRLPLQLEKTKTFTQGAVVLYYRVHK